MPADSIFNDISLHPDVERKLRKIGEDYLRALEAGTVKKPVVPEWRKAIMGAAGLGNYPVLHSQQTIDLITKKVIDQVRKENEEQLREMDKRLREAEAVKETIRILSRIHNSELHDLKLDYYLQMADPVGKAEEERDRIFHYYTEIDPDEDVACGFYAHYEKLIENLKIETRERETEENPEAEPPVN